jgi:hypothetical protein
MTPRAYLTTCLAFYEHYRNLRKGMLRSAHLQLLTLSYRLDGTAHVMGTLHPYTKRDSTFLNSSYVGVQCPTHFQNGAP